MGDGVSWIAQTFKLFDALINPWRSERPDPRVVTESSDGLAPEATADKPPSSNVPVEPAPEADALAPHEEVKVETSVSAQIESPPDDDESRRKLIRQLFNEYWNGVAEKPPTFAERLEIAERYINDQLAGTLAKGSNPEFSARAERGHIGSCRVDPTVTFERAAKG
jgi:hypothetical protein